MRTSAQLQWVLIVQATLYSYAVSIHSQSFSAFCHLDAPITHVVHIRHLPGCRFMRIQLNLIHDMRRYLDPDYRRPLILLELLGFHADIICLQEMDEKAFAEYFLPQMQQAGRG